MFRPTFEKVARATDGETVDLSMLAGQRMRFIDQIEPAHRLRVVSAIGMRFPLESTANGKAALATLDDADVETAPSRLDPEVGVGLRREIAEPADRHRFRPRRTHPGNLGARHCRTRPKRHRFGAWPSTAFGATGGT